MKNTSIYIGWMGLLCLLACVRKDNLLPAKERYLGQTPPGSTPQVFAPDMVSTEDHVEYGCTFSPDFREFYFTRIGGINSPHLDAHPFIAPDESYLIFDSNRPGGFGETDLYVCFRDSRGNWSEAVNLGETINSSEGIGLAMISPDGKYLFYTYRNDIYWVDANIIETLRPNE